MNLNTAEVDLHRRRDLMKSVFRARFGREPTIGARAPGRVDLMGSHTDYNEGYVLTLTIDRDTWVVADPRDDKLIRLHSVNIDSDVEFRSGDAPGQKIDGWGRYLQGVAVVLRQAGYPVPGFDAVVHGTVPIGSGLSSSASLEAAMATILEQLGEFQLLGLEKARFCQQAENQWVGVNCGILDQYSSVLGEQGKALLLDCRQMTHQYAHVPDDLQLVICNTCAPRQLSGSEYGDRRAMCEQAAAWFAKFDDGVRALRDVSRTLLEAHESRLPADVARRARFVIEENQRVLEMAVALRCNDRAAIGRLCRQSFAGAGKLFEITVPEMDHMFHAMLDGPGCVGCRQAGAGFGGCMVALVETSEVDAFCKHVPDAYQSQSGITPEVYAVQSATGAGALSLLP